MISLLFLFPLSFFSSYNAHKAYQQNKFIEAQELLEKEQVERPNDALVNYNLGTTYYKQKKYDLAKKSFCRAATHAFATTNDSNRLLEKSRFNLGNCFYKNTRAHLPEGWEHKTLDDQICKWAIQEIQQAIEQYKSTLSMNKNNERAQVNKKAAEALLAKLMKQKQNQQKQQNQQKKDQQKQKQQNQQTQDQKQDQQQKKQNQPQQQKPDSKKLDKRDKTESMEKRRVQALLNKLQEQEKKLQKNLLKEKVKTNAKPKNSYQKPW